MHLNMNILKIIADHRINLLGCRGISAICHGTMPPVEMFTYSTETRRMAQGRGIFSMQFSHFSDSQRPAYFGG